MHVDRKQLSNRLMQALGWPSVELTAMDGATSARLFIARSVDREVVVRIFDANRWEESTSSLSDREGSILKLLAGAGLAAPELITTLPDNGVVMTLMPGRVWLPQKPDPTWLQTLAEMLTRIHQTPVVVPWVYQSWNNLRGQEPVDWWNDSDLWKRCQQILNARPATSTTLIHRDYHPVNVLWQDQQISAVVDWVNACMGPAAVDVAHCRLNLALMYGTLAADDFLTVYRRMNPNWQYQPYWDLDAAFSSLPDPQPYPPWQHFGLTGLDQKIIRQRLVAFSTSALENVNRQGDQL